MRQSITLLLLAALMILMEMFFRSDGTLSLFGVIYITGSCVCRAIEDLDRGRGSL